MLSLVGRLFYPKSSYSEGKKESSRTKDGISPLLTSNIELVIPNVELKPNLEEIQSALLEAARFVTLVEIVFMLCAVTDSNDGTGASWRSAEA